MFPVTAFQTEVYGETVRVCCPGTRCLLHKGFILLTGFVVSLGFFGFVLFVVCLGCGILLFVIVLRAVAQPAPGASRFL